MSRWSRRRVGGASSYALPRTPDQFHPGPSFAADQVPLLGFGDGTLPRLTRSGAAVPLAVVDKDFTVAAADIVQLGSPDRGTVGDMMNHHIADRRLVDTVH